MDTVGEVTPRKKGIFKKGQIKMSAYMNFGLLTVHVVQGRHLCSKWRRQAHSFALVSVIPDDTNTARCRTAVVKETNSPVFNEKFSFELADDDMNKRLMISVWHRDPQSGMQEFLGCTSFGLRHLKRAEKEVNGWYHLLAEEVGCKKHLHVATKKRPEIRQLDPLSQPQIPSVNKDIRGLEHRDITVHRGKNGFGFTLIDSCPVKISRVDGASRAEQAGLQSGDLIIRVNGQNVSRSTSVSVAKIIKKCGSMVTLEIQRPCPTYDHSEYVCMNPNGPSSRSESSCSSVQEFSIYDDRAFLLNQSSLSIDTRRQAALHRLLCMEENFVELMHRGIQTFSRPLRHCILSSSQHDILFQNIEKLVSIAEYQAHQIQMNLPTHSLSDDESDTSFVGDQDLTYSVGMIYYSKLQMLIQAYSLYVTGLSSAAKLLSQLERSQEFRHFIQNTQTKGSYMSLSEFINRPVHHFHDLCGLLTAVRDATHPQSKERKLYFTIVQGMQQVVNVIEFREPFRSCPTPMPAFNTSVCRGPFPKMGASALKRSGSLSSQTSSSSGIGTGSASSHSDDPVSSTHTDSAFNLNHHSLESVIF